jgi:hypothetical protein
MRRDRERRLGALETRRFGSERVAAIIRRIDALSVQEMREQLIAEVTGEASVGFDLVGFDLQTLTHAELVWLIAEFETRAAYAADVPNHGTEPQTP